MITIGDEKRHVKIDEEGVVTVNSPELMDELIHSNEAVLKELDEKLGVKASDISISEDGKIQIKNLAFAVGILKDLGNVKFDIPLAIKCNIQKVPLAQKCVLEKLNKLCQIQIVNTLLKCHINPALVCVICKPLDPDGPKKPGPDPIP